MSDDKHSILHGIQTQGPCGVSWESMQGGDRVRRCGVCKLNVYRVEGCSDDETRKLIAPNGSRGRLELYMRQDRTVTTVPCLEARFKNSVGAYGGIFTAIGIFALIVVGIFWWARQALNQELHNENFSTVVSQLNALNDYSSKQYQAYPTYPIYPRSMKIKRY